MEERELLWCLTNGHPVLRCFNRDLRGKSSLTRSSSCANIKARSSVSFLHHSRRLRLAKLSQRLSSPAAVRAFITSEMPLRRSRSSARKHIRVSQLLHRPHSTQSMSFVIPSLLGKKSLPRRADQSAKRLSYSDVVPSTLAPHQLGVFKNSRTFRSLSLRKAVFFLLNSYDLALAQAVIR